ncbi:NADH-quinone oxidoreductase subunit C [Pleomorphomonas carboxyditropha]|uniref:NADH-quinone oxidoreductase subunit C n=1 Tax=Pleomorphomonas carboxyditropha TaxID=2023338 RepID=A0A2G9WSP5_9HYPH|nr:NADH-quinone oxidoreductase subunit C [Pleomorphomonas carboxyditropha]PIO97738.1 NADH-quinone oxidoreductase subunit C [Pleomorphomonas carboxyditropha]
MSEAPNELALAVAGTLGADAVSVNVAYGEVTAVVARDRIVDVVTRLRDAPELAFISIIDVCGVDYPERPERFDVVYHLLSPSRNARLRLKVTTGEETPVPSISGVFPGAQWFEREAYDLFGILFTGHPELRRLLTDYGFDGHPLRKDFPMTGYVEVRYDDIQKRVVYEPVRLNQEFRNFDFLSPWEGTTYVLPGDEKVKTN